LYRRQELETRQPKTPFEQWIAVYGDKILPSRRSSTTSDSMSQRVSSASSQRLSILSMFNTSSTAGGSLDSYYVMYVLSIQDKS